MARHKCHLQLDAQAKLIGRRWFYFKLDKVTSLWRARPFSIALSWCEGAGGSSGLTVGRVPAAADF